MLSSLEGVLEVQSRIGPLDADLRLATADSRQAGEGVLFAAIPGARFDGHDFIPAALESGSPAVLVERLPELQSWPKDRVALQVGDARRALAIAAHMLEGRPSEAMRCIGITGTNGKTSTVGILRSILASAGLATGSLGTTGISWDERGRVVHHEATHTTPEGPQLYSWLARMRDAGVQVVAMELSSHALAQGRAAGLQLDVGAWTNLSHDHLDFHGSMADYEAAKARLFTEWLARWGKPGCQAVVNADDPAVARHAEDHPRTLTFSCRTDSGADIRPLSKPEFSIEGCVALVRTPVGDFELVTRLLGPHNFANALTATACALGIGIELDAVVAGLAASSGAPGRLQRVVGPEGTPSVLVDYAHTPEALEKAIEALRPLTSGRLTTVFGCGGDRDSDKRPVMAAAAAASDRVVLTSDNPRSEDPEAILDQVEAGLAGHEVPYCRIPDRRSAIADAIRAAGPGDVVLIAGKGHETYQEIAGRRLPFDDRAVAAEELASR